MKKVTLIEMLLLGLMTVSLSMSIFGKPATSKEIHFRVDMTSQLANVKDKSSVGVRGSLAPLSWEKTYLLSDEDQDGIYEGIIKFTDSDQELAFKFFHDSDVWELTTEGNRTLDLSKDDLIVPLYTWNENPPFSKAEIEARRIPKEKLLEDFELVKTAYTTMHPGLYRYNTPEQVEQNLAQLKADLSQDLTIPEAYIAFSKFVATIKCGHTYANFWNQPTVVKRAVTYQPDKVPFHFRIAENRMIITQSADEKSLLQKGQEVLAINGYQVADILAVLLPLQRTDGANTAQQLVNLQLFGAEKFEAFDMFFPILFPPVDGFYEVTTANIDGTQKATQTVAAMSRKDRVKVIKQRFPEAIPEMGPDLWQFEMIDEQTALLTLHTFAIFNWDFDWKAYIQNVFATLKEKAIPNLIIDIRLNGGGADMVGLELMKNISQEKLVQPARKELARFTTFPPSVKPHLRTWGDWFEEETLPRLKPIEDGYYSVDGKVTKEEKAKPYKHNYQGDVYLLVSPFNSSATYYLAGAAKRANAATLVGRETGGNQRGINGGLIYFLTLPNSKIELDIPVVGDFQLGEHPNKGYEPDVFVAPKAADIAAGIDTELAATLALIKKKKDE
ncbi:MAG: S41 family peptidase [Bacteroidota bacterium]